MITRLLSQVRIWLPPLILALLYLPTRLPDIGPAERSSIAQRFRFTVASIPEVQGVPERTIREVHPDLQHLAAWISSVGAACAMADLDGNGLANDLCYVDTRTNQVTVCAAPDTASYPPFLLEPAPLPFNSQTMAPMGCVPGDYNEDGRLDMLVYYWGRTPVLFLQHGTTKSRDDLAATAFTPVELVHTDERWFTNSATRADVDGDGHVDIIIGNYFQDDAHVLDPTATDHQHMHHAMSRATNGGANRLLLWSHIQPDSDLSIPAQVVFEDASSAFAPEWAHGWSLGVGAADLDGDALPELYFANDFGHDRLLHNRSQPGRPRFVELVGRKGLTTPNSKVLGRDSFKGMGVDFADANGDGLLDIYVSNIAEMFALEESHFLWINTGETELMQQGIAPFVERAEQLGVSRSGWGWESRLADFDNDGQVEAIQATGFVKGTRNRWPQLHEAAMGNDLLLRYPGNWHRVVEGDDLSGHDPNAFFVRASDGRFYDIAKELRIDTPQVTRGIATADVDGDGDLDFMFANQWDVSRFYRNDCPRPGNFLGLRFKRDLTDRTDHVAVQPGLKPVAHSTCDAIGTSVRVTLAGGHTLVGQVDGGNGHSGVRSPDLHFGLGHTSPDAAIQVSFTWRDSRGTIHNESRDMTPGWHTVLLPRIAANHNAASPGTTFQGATSDSPVTANKHPLLSATEVPQ
ncbi:MAG: CRTAC1 family protein [Planctomycetales bacterium]|nr:CRTAC1 family protein [Planctomycetales bacterium]